MHVIELLNTYVYIITNDITFPAVGLVTLQAWLKGVKQNCSSHINDVLNPTTDRIPGGGRGHALMSPPDQPHHLWWAKNCCGCYDWAQLCQRKENKTLRSCASNSKQTLWWSVPRNINPISTCYDQHIICPVFRLWIVTVHHRPVSQVCHPSTLKSDLSVTIRQLERTGMSTDKLCWDPEWRPEVQTVLTMSTVLTRHTFHLFTYSTSMRAAQKMRHDSKGNHPLCKMSIIQNDIFLLLLLEIYTCS